ncbi:hypothetical protein GCM10027169_07260 [Gordonia jinhuaensis]|uniref:ESAT-6-like protein n=1 Tax=Gordonia jinhuaensis TaxID=1517702 RepID=A0A916SXW9_9ACTN|nr:WXG100 family type VII secretion target [Gordonia jinhuaensis]GGB21322.1 hypothetical protein GCM10011489_06860 [Gordonia jinhuaensis]
MATQLDIQGMHAAINKAKDAHSQMGALLGRVNSTVQESSGVWKGSAQAAFMQVGAEYHEAANKMQTSMQQMIDMLNDNMNKYASQEEQAASSLKSAGGGLNLG